MEMVSRNRGTEKGMDKERRRGTPFLLIRTAKVKEDRPI